MVWTVKHWNRSRERDEKGEWLRTKCRVRDVEYAVYVVNEFRELFHFCNRGWTFWTRFDAMVFHVSNGLQIFVCRGREQFSQSPFCDITCRRSSGDRTKAHISDQWFMRKQYFPGRWGRIAGTDNACRNMWPSSSSEFSHSTSNFCPFSRSSIEFIGVLFASKMPRFS